MSSARRYVFIFLFFTFVLCPRVARALEPKMHTLTLAPEVEYYTYKVSNFKEKGLLYGLAGSYTYRGEFFYESISKAMFKIDGRIIFGRIKFDGQLFDGNEHSINDSKEFITEVRGLAGYDFSIFSDTIITPFTGLGYRLLSDNLSNANAGYRREAHYLYTPLGFETNTLLAAGWSAGMSAEYDFLWFGRRETYLSDLDPLFSDLVNDQNNGYGIKASLKVRKEMEDKNYIFEPYFNYWNIDSSDTKKVYHTGVWGGLTYQELQSRSTEIGMKVAVEF